MVVMVVVMMMVVMAMVMVVMAMAMVMVMVMAMAMAMVMVMIVVMVSVLAPTSVPSLTNIVATRGRYSTHLAITIGQKAFRITNHNTERTHDSQ